MVVGLLNKQVGSDLGISEITVKAHRGRMMQKMKADSLADLVNMAMRLGLARAPKAHIILSEKDDRAISLRQISRTAEPALVLSKLGVEHDTNSRIRLKTKAVVSSDRTWDSQAVRFWPGAQTTVPAIFKVST